MQRKIIRQGHNTLTITIPNKWAKKFNLQAGDEINVAEKDNGLVLNTERTDSKPHAEIDIRGLDIPSIWKYFMAVYREGYDEVRVLFSRDDTYDNPYKFITHNAFDKRYMTRDKYSPVELIRLIAGRFIGFELVEHKDNYCVIKDMAEVSSKEFDLSLRRIFMIIEQMEDELTEALKTGNTKILEHTHDTDINLDKFHDYCIRVLNKTSCKDTRKTSLLSSTLYLLELMGDEFKHISHHMMRDFSKKDFQNLKELANLVLEEVNMFRDIFYDFSREKLLKISKIDRELYSYLPNLYKKNSSKSFLKPEELEVFNHLRRIKRDINALLELRVEMEF